MTRERYSQWMAVWKWFKGQKPSSELEDLYGMLNTMWQQDRQSSTPEQLAEYSQSFDIENDPEFKKFMQELDKGFSKE